MLPHACRYHSMTQHTTLLMHDAKHAWPALCLLTSGSRQALGSRSDNPHIPGPRWQLAALVMPGQVCRVRGLCMRYSQE